MIRTVLLCAAMLAPEAVAGSPSECFGRVGNGRLQNAVKLPLDGPNFSAYSKIAAAAGRTWVHSTSAAIMLDAYRAAELTQPGVSYVYGETGLAGGGRFRPHRTHQNGLSVDFFVPVRDSAGKSVPLPTELLQRFGYDIEFDASGTYGKYRVDYNALAEHLYQLDVSARAMGSGLALVILDPLFMQRVFATARGPHLRRHVPFMKGKPWVRHDEHYHVDFKIGCKP